MSVNINVRYFAKWVEYIDLTALIRFFTTQGWEIQWYMIRSNLIKCGKYVYSNYLHTSFDANCTVEIKKKYISFGCHLQHNSDV